MLKVTMNKLKVVAIAVGGALLLLNGYRLVSHRVPE